jgi:hypothetical protein
MNLLPLGVFSALMFVVTFAFYVAAVVVGMYVWERWVKPRVIG